MTTRKREEAPAAKQGTSPGSIEALEKHRRPWGENTRRTFTPDEVRAQESAVEQLLVQGVTNRQVALTMRKQFDVGEARTRTLINRTHQRWEAESELGRASRKEATVRRISRRIVSLDQRLQGQRGEHGEVVVAPVTKPGEIAAIHGALHKWESLLAEVEGTLAPVKVEVSVQVSQAILQIIATMTPEEVSQAMSALDEQERKAKLFDAVKDTAAE